MILTMKAEREGYAPNQIARTMTVGELIEFLTISTRMKRSTSAMTTATPTAELPPTGSKKSMRKKKNNQQPTRAVERPLGTNGAKMKICEICCREGANLHRIKNHFIRKRRHK